MKKFVIAACLVTSIAHAETFVEQDNRIRNEVYNKDAVYNVFTKVGRASLIQFEDDETLVVSPSSILGIGEANDWDLGVRGSSLAIKPLKAKPATNLVVVTNKRSYAFELLPAPKNAVPTYILRYRYFDTEQARAAAEAAAEAKRVGITAASKAAKIKINTDYAWKGSNELFKPTAAYDDGRFTRLIYDSAAELPVFYKVLPDGTEALLNYNVDPADRRIVILQEVIRTARARQGNDVIEIVNQAYTQPKLNMTGTSVHGAVRVEKGSEQ